MGTVLYLPHQNTSPVELFNKWLPENRSALELLCRKYVPDMPLHVAFIFLGENGGNRTLTWDTDKICVSNEFLVEALITLTLDEEMLPELLRTLKDIAGSDELKLSLNNKGKHSASKTDAVLERIEETPGTFRIEITDPCRPLVFAVKLGGLIEFDPEVTVKVDRKGISELVAGRTSAGELVRTGMIEFSGDAGLFFQAALIFLADD